MTVLDMIMLLLCGGMAVMGYLRGFVQEILSLFAWVLAVIVVRLFLAPTTELAALWVGSTAAGGVLAFAGLFAVTFLAGRMLARRAGKGMRASMVGMVDRVLGMGFGAVKGLVIGTIVFLAFILLYNLVYGIDSPRPTWMSQSRSYPLLRASGDAMSQFVRDRNVPPEALDPDGNADGPPGVSGHNDDEPEGDGAGPDNEG